MTTEYQSIPIIEAGPQVAIHFHRPTFNYRYFIGISCLLVMVVTWIASSFTVQETLTKFSFHGVFFTTYCINLVFPFVMLIRSLIFTQFSALPGQHAQVTLKQYLRWSALFGPMWLVMNFGLNMSLQYTSIASNNSLSTLSSAFTMLFAYIFAKTLPTFWKLVGVAATVVGVVLIGIPDSQSDSGAPMQISGPFGLSAPVFGDIMEITSATFYGLFTCLIDRKVATHNVDMGNFFGFCGIINLIVFSPVVVVLHVFKIEDLSNVTLLMLIFLTLSGALSVGSDFFLANSVIYTSPLIANVGLSLTIPASLLLDVFINHKEFGLLYIAGSMLVLLGFLFVNVDFRREHQKELETSDTITPVQKCTE